MKPLEAATAFAARGWSVIPVPYRNKNPGKRGWERMRLKVDDLPYYFNGQPQNVGVLLGDGNIVSMDSSAAGGTSDWDATFSYDGLNRLTDFKRGTLASAVISGANLKFQQTWSLDALGNWKSFTEDADGNGGGSAVTQSRSTNAVNEITGYTANPESWAAPAYDASGNMTTAPKGQGSESTAQSLIYDGWNRQAGVDANGDGDLTDSGDYRYTYDGLGRRITKFQDTANDGSNDAGNTEEFFFNENYQVVEVRKGTVASGTKTVDADPSERYLWDQAYIDAPAMVERDTNTDGTRDHRLWPTYDANFNVTALVSDAGVTVERYAYTPYGERIILNGDQNYANTAADPDGAEFTVDTNGSDFAFLLGHQGLRLDAETGSYYNRARYLNSSLGVFEQRDPLAIAVPRTFGPSKNFLIQGNQRFVPTPSQPMFPDGLNIYAAVRSNPLQFRDPSGEVAVADDALILVVGGIILAGAAASAYLSNSAPIPANTAGSIQSLADDATNAVSNLANNTSNAVNRAFDDAYGACFASRGKHENEWSRLAKVARMKGADPCVWLMVQYHKARASGNNVDAMAIKLAQKIMGCRHSRGR